MGSYIQLMPNGKKLLPSLQKMQQVFSRLQISDLTSENVIITGLDEQSCPTKVSKAVAIDLEARGTKTHLGVVADETLLNEEIDCIDQYFQLKPGWIQRIILVGTQDLLGWFMSSIGDPLSINTHVGVLCGLITDEYEEMVDTHKLLVQGVIEDFLSDDVPYFTEMNGMLYYGLPSRGLKIGIKVESEGLL